MRFFCNKKIGKRCRSMFGFRKFASHKLLVSIRSSDSFYKLLNAHTILHVWYNKKGMGIAQKNKSIEKTIYLMLKNDIQKLS